MIQGSTFSNLSAIEGGAVYLTSESESTQIMIEGNLFENNKA